MHYRIYKIFVVSLVLIILFVVSGCKDDNTQDNPETTTLPITSVGANINTSTNIDTTDYSKIFNVEKKDLKKMDSEYAFDMYIDSNGIEYGFSYSQNCLVSVTDTKAIDLIPKLTSNDALNDEKLWSIAEKILSYLTDVDRYSERKVIRSSDEPDSSVSFNFIYYIDGYKTSDTAYVTLLCDGTFYSINLLGYKYTEGVDTSIINDDDIIRKLEETIKNEYGKQMKYEILNQHLGRFEDKISMSFTITVELDSGRNSRALYYFIPIE